MKTKFLKTLTLIALLLSIVSCAPPVQRMREDSVTDISGRWNETDVRLTSEQIVEELHTKAWYNNFIAENKGKKPVIIVGMITNKTHEHIDPEMFCKNVEISIVDSQRMKLVQSGNKRAELRAEIADQQTYASKESMKKFGLANGADFILQGNIGSIVDEKGKQKTVFYKVNLELTNLQSNEVVWIGNKEIKKYLGNKKQNTINVQPNGN
jgi:penicillin-binding protein activator